MFTIETVEKFLLYSYLIILPISAFLWLTPLSKIVVRVLIHFKHTEIERNALFNQYRNGVAIVNPLLLNKREQFNLILFPVLVFLYSILTSPYDYSLFIYTGIVSILLVGIFIPIANSMYYSIINGLHFSKKIKSVKKKH